MLRFAVLDQVNFDDEAAVAGDGVATTGDGAIAVDDVDDNGIDVDESDGDEDQSDSDSSDSIATAEADEARLKQRYEHALRLQGGGEFAEARAVFEELLAAPFLAIPESRVVSTRHPAVALRYTANSNLGKVCVALGDHRTALVHFLDALRLDDTDVNVALAAGEAASQIGLWPVARRVLEAALRLRPRHWTVFERLADVLYAIDETACESLLARCLLLDPAYPYALNLRAHLRGEPADARHFASALALRTRHDSMYVDASAALTGGAVSAQLAVADSLVLTSLTWTALAQLLLTTLTKRFTLPGLQYCRTVRLCLSLAEPKQQPLRKRKLEDEIDHDATDATITVTNTTTTANTTTTTTNSTNNDAAASAVTAVPIDVDDGDDGRVIIDVIVDVDADEGASQSLFVDSQIVRRSKRHERAGDARTTSLNPVDIVLSFVSAPVEIDNADASVARGKSGEPTKVTVDDVSAIAGGEDESVDVQQFVAQFAEPSAFSAVLAQFWTRAVAEAVRSDALRATSTSAAWTRVWRDPLFRSLFAALHSAAIESAMIERVPVAHELTMLDVMHEMSSRPDVAALAHALVKEALGSATLLLPPSVRPTTPTQRTRARRKKRGHANSAESSEIDYAGQTLMRLMHHVMSELEQKEVDSGEEGQAAVAAPSLLLERIRLHWFLARLSIAASAASDAVAHLERCRALVQSRGATAGIELRHVSEQWSAIDLAHVEQWLERANAQLRTQLAEGAVDKGDYGTVFATMLPVLASHRLPLATIAPMATSDELSDAHTSDFRMLRALLAAALARCELSVALRCATILVSSLCRQPKLQTAAQTVELLGVVNDCVAHPLARQGELAAMSDSLRRLVWHVAQLWRAPASRRLAKQEKFVHRCLSVVVAGTLMAADSVVTGDAAVLFGAAHDLLGRQRWCAQFRGSFLELMLSRLCNGSIVHPRHTIEPLDTAEGDDSPEEVVAVAAVAATSGADASDGDDSDDDNAIVGDDSSIGDARGEPLADEENSRLNSGAIDRDDTASADEHRLESARAVAPDDAAALIDAPAPAEHDVLDSRITQALFCHYGIKLRAEVSESHIGERDVYPLVSRVEVLRTVWFVWRFGYLNVPAVRTQVMQVVKALYSHALEPPARVAVHRDFVDGVLAGTTERQLPAAMPESGNADANALPCFSAHEITTVADAHARGVVGRRCHMLWPDDHAWYRGVALDVRARVDGNGDNESADNDAPRAAVQVLVRYDDDGDSHWEDCNGYLIVAERPEESYEEFDGLFGEGFAALSRYLQRRAQYELASNVLVRSLYCTPSRIESWVQLGLIYSARARSTSLVAEARTEVLRLARVALAHARYLCEQVPGEALASEAAINAALGSLVCDQLSTTPAVHPAFASLHAGVLSTVGSYPFDGHAEDDDDEDGDDGDDGDDGLHDARKATAAGRRFPLPLPGTIFVRVSETASGDDDSEEATGTIRAAAALRVRLLQEALDFYVSSRAQHETWQTTYMAGKLSEKVAFARACSNALNESGDARIDPAALAKFVCEEQGALAQSLALYTRCGELVANAAAVDAKMPLDYLTAELLYRRHALRLRAYIYAGTCLLGGASTKVRRAFLQVILDSPFFVRNGITVVANDVSRRSLAARLARIAVDHSSHAALFSLLEQYMHVPAEGEQHLLVRVTRGIGDCLIAFEACRSYAASFRKANFRAALLVGFGLAPFADPLSDNDAEVSKWADDLRAAASRLARNRMLFTKARTLDSALANWAQERSVVDRAPKLVRDLRRYLVLDARLAVMVPAYAERLDDLCAMAKAHAELADFVEPLCFNFWVTRERALSDELEAVRTDVENARRGQAGGVFVPVTREVALMMQRASPIGIGDFPGLALFKAWTVFGDARAHLRQWRIEQSLHESADEQLQHRIDFYGFVARKALALSFDLYSLALATEDDKEAFRNALQLRIGGTANASTNEDVATDDTVHMLRVVATCEQLFAQKGATRKLTRVTLFAHLGIAN